MQVVLASGNPHKFEEFSTLVHKARLGIRFLDAGAIGGMPAVEESAETLEENALLKARALAERVPGGSWVLADDSGLEVDALNGAPGVRSARFAGPGGIAAANNLKLLAELKGIPLEKRTARFSCVLYFLQVGGEGHVFTGTCEGHILEHPRGWRGFGYDPLFRPVGYKRTFAEMAASTKNSLSHRARAVRQWIAWLKANTV